jgi:hypothetical protein
LTDAAAQNCAQNIFRYKEIHGKNPSSGQMAKMIEISREFENKEHGYRSYGRDTTEIDFLHRREGDLLFMHGLSYDASRDLDLSKSHVNKSLEKIQKQMEQDRVHEKQMGLGLEEENFYKTSFLSQSFWPQKWGFSPTRAFQR